MYKLLICPPASQSGDNKAAVLNDELSLIICGFKLLAQLCDPDPEVDLPDVPDACLRPDLGPPLLHNSIH